MYTQKLYNESIPIEKILYYNFIKYTSLQKMVYKEFAGSDATEVNIFIDLNQIFLKAFRFLRVEDYYSMTSCAINYCAHLRAYFRTRHYTESNIILVYSHNMSSNNTKFMAEYNNRYANRMRSNEKIMTVLRDNLKMLRLLCPYLPAIYYKEGTVEPGVIIKDAIDTVFTKNPNIVVSDSDYCFQLPVFTRDTVVFRRKTIDGNDASYSYNALDAMDAFVYEIKNVSRIPDGIPKRFIPILMVLSGLPKRCVSSVFDIRHALEILKWIPITIYGDTEAMYSCVKNYFAHTKAKTSMSFAEFDNRFKAIDLLYQQKLYQFLPESKERSYLNRLQDPDSVKAINNKYFRKNPIDLERL